MILLLLLMMHGVLIPMDRQNAVAIRSESNSPFNIAPSPSETSEEDDLCEMAISRYAHPKFDISKYIRPILKSMLGDQSDSPIIERIGSNADVLRRVRSGDDTDPLGTDQQIHEMVMKATHQAFEERERIISAKNARIKEKYSGKKTAAIAVIVGTISTIVATVCATIVTLSKK